MRRILASALAASLLIALAPPAAAYPRPGRTERVSVAWDGGEADNYSAYPSLSADGRFVVFDSDASNLVAGDENGANDIFVFDRERRTTRRVSVRADGSESAEPSYLARINDTGRFVTFLTHEALVPDDTGQGDVYLADLETGAVERISVDSQERQADSLSFPGEVTPDGRHVAFDSFAPNLAPGDGNDKSDVFVRDRAEGTTTRVSLQADGTERVGDSFSPSISDDGRYVAYTALVGTMGEDNPDVIDEMQAFVHDRQTGRVDLASVGVDGRRGNGFSTDVDLSADGRFLAFSSQASNLVPNDTNRAQDVFVRDLATGVTERVSVRADGSESPGASGQFAMSDDGRFLAIGTAAALDPGDTNGQKDVYVRDRLGGTTERVTVSATGVQSTKHTENPFISGDGRHVAFAAYGPEFVAGDTNAARDIFVRDRGPGLGVGAVDATRGAGGISVDGWATFSPVEASAALDEGGDAGAADEVGADLVRASVWHRPESEDVLVRMDVTSLPGATTPPATGGHIGCALFGACGASAAGVPAVVYGLQLQIEDRRYEVRAMRASATGPGAPAFGLYRCDPTCAHHATLQGTVGTTGPTVSVAVPLSALGAAPGARLTQLRAFTGAGELAAGAIHTLDVAVLPDAPLAAPELLVGHAPAGTPASDVALEPVPLANGRFEAALPAVAGPRDVWARACLGSACTASSARVH